MYKHYFMQKYGKLPIKYPYYPFLLVHDPDHISILDAFFVMIPVRHIFSWYTQFSGILKTAFLDPVRHLYDVILTVLSDGESQHKFLNNELHNY